MWQDNRGWSSGAPPLTLSLPLLNWTGVRKMKNLVDEKACGNSPVTITGKT